MSNFKKYACFAVLLLCTATTWGEPSAIQSKQSAGPDNNKNNNKRLSLEKTIALAQTNDAWLKGSKLREQSLIEEADAIGRLPDPVMSLGIANVPVDNLKLDQDGMTQLLVGVTQRFPRGESLDLQSQKSLLKAATNPYMRAERRAQIKQKVSELWLDSYLADKTIQLIQSERHLFEQLIDVTNARYSSASGMARQQDVIRSQLELTKLEDRLTGLLILSEANKAMLAEWLPSEWHDSQFSGELPYILLLVDISHQEEIQRVIMQHPTLQIIEKNIIIEQTDIDIARQEYKPGWAINTSYGYRDDAPNGMQRDDFISIGVSFDLPMFSANRNDKKVSAAALRKQASTTDYELQKRYLVAQWQRVQSKLSRLNERSEIYKNRLLTQMHVQTEAALAGYTSDNGDFAEVMRAYIAELNSKIEALEIDIEKQKAKAQINYLLAGVEFSIIYSAGENHE